ncbi:hypothetical protein Clocl_0796 [Acetivibrio clariflavus DSM 19732]|uniref:Uncharacterized protein n=1 Tax=Acetivibrio clariflavus (strain DSM 19732 / NBRC 101661 / EBR45) TaxID=720554 RepID=G8LVS9_ACECE|nr:hypothetical protein Clocl_0796 [Acetivibrio clariflavus DSM 19732]
MYILRKYNLEQKSNAIKSEKQYTGICIDIGIHWLNPLPYIKCDKPLNRMH